MGLWWGADWDSLSKAVRRGGGERHAACPKRSAGVRYAAACTDLCRCATCCSCGVCARMLTLLLSLLHTRFRTG